jgi:hypothetical protein
MFFRGEDDLAIHTIIGAVDALLVDMAAAKGVVLELEEFQRRVVPHLSRSELLTAERQLQNFLKHAKRDPSGVIEYHPGVNELRIFFISEHYGQVIPVTDPIINTYRVWFVWKRSAGISGGGFGQATAELAALVGSPENHEAMLNVISRM